MVEGYPSATFGKPEQASAYQIIDQAPEFEAPEIARAFQKICQGFEWRPTNSGLQHRPCHGHLRVGDTVLLARFRDTGRDAAGRPHTVKIDCLLAPAGDLQSAWNHLTQGKIPPPRPDGAELVIVGDPDTFWSASE